MQIRGRKYERNQENVCVQGERERERARNKEI